MKRVAAVLTSIVMILAFAVSPAMAAVSGSDSIDVPSGVSMGENIAVWSTYMFFTGSDGIDVVDMKSGEAEAKWTFVNGEIEGVSRFVPVETVVNDNYIIVSNGQSVVVFKNAKGFSDEIPEIAARIVKGRGSSFKAIKKMIEDNNTLYIFEYTRDGESIVWKLPLDEASEAAASGVVYANEISACASLGKSDYVWSKIKANDGKAYAVLYNDEKTVPNKNLRLAEVDLDTLEVSECVLKSGKGNGLSLEINAAGDIDEDELLSSEIYMVGNEETRITVGVLSAAGYIDIEVEGSQARLTINSADAETALASIFGCSTKDIQDNQVIFKIDYEGRSNSFYYNKNSDVFEDGTIAFDGDYIYVHSGSETTKNKLFVVRKSGDGLRLSNSYTATAIGSSTAAVDMFCTGDRLVAIYKNSAAIAMVYDISNPNRIPYNIAENLRINGSMKATEHSEIIKWGNGYYYIATGNNGIGVIKTDGTLRTAEMSITEGKLPVRFFGFGVDGETVKISIDGGSEIVTDINNGLWSYDINAIAPGVHEAEIANGSHCETLSFETSTENPVGVEVEVIDDMLVQITLTNNTDKYSKLLRNSTFRIHTMVVESDGELFLSDTGTISSLGFGNSQTYSPAVFFSLEDGQTVEIFVTDENDNPIAAKTVIDGSGVHYGTIPSVLGRVGGITMEVKQIDYENKKVEVGGHVETDCTRLIYLTIGGAFMPRTKEVLTDENGDFTFEYEYGSDYLFGDVTYSITGRVLGGGDGTEASVEFTVMDNTRFENALNEVKNEITTGAELKEYFEKSNPGFAYTIGVNLSSTDYNSLSDSVKADLMEDILAEIKNGSKNVKAEFDAGAANRRIAARQAEALAAIKAETTTKATLTGVLEEYRDVFEISDATWNKYKKSKQIQSVNAEFLRHTVNSVSEVEDILKAAISSVSNPGGGGGGGTKVDPVGGIGGNMEISIDYINDNSAGQKSKYFDDISTVSWAESQINKLAEKGIVCGVSDRIFAPNRNVSREEFVKMLVNALNLYDDGAVTTFTDVTADSWAYKYIASAQKCGLTNGNSENKFGMGQLISREEMATMAYRAMVLAGKQVGSGTLNYSDSEQISSYAIEAVGAMSGAGILNGMENNRFAPKDACSRAMAAKVIYEIIS